MILATRRGNASLNAQACVPTVVSIPRPDPRRTLPPTLRFRDCREMVVVDSAAEAAAVHFQTWITFCVSELGSAELLGWPSRLLNLVLDLGGAEAVWVAAAEFRRRSGDYRNTHAHHDRRRSAFDCTIASCSTRRLPSWGVGSRVAQSIPALRKSFG